LGELTALPEQLDFRGLSLLLRETRGGEEAKKGKEGEGTNRGREGNGGRPLPSPPLFARHSVRRALLGVRDSG